MSTRNIRDGELYLLSGAPEEVAASQGMAITEYGGDFYRFYTFNEGAYYSLRRMVSNNPLDFRSTTGAVVANLGTAAPKHGFLWAIASNNWLYLYAADDGSGDSIYVVKSTDQGATWTDEAELIGPGATWAASDINSPSAFDNGDGNFILFAVGDNDQVGVYVCDDGDDPTVPGNWSEPADTNPVYDSPLGGLRALAYYDSTRAAIVLRMTKYTATGDGDDWFWVSRAAYPVVAGTYFNHGNKVGTWNGSTAVYLGQSFKGSDGVWYHYGWPLAGSTQAWISARAHTGMIPVSCAAPKYLPSATNVKISFPEGGLSWTEKREVYVQRHRGQIDHLRAKEGGLTARFASKFADVSALTDRLKDGTTTGRLGDGQANGVMLGIKNPAGTWTEFMYIPFATGGYDIAEGDDGDTFSIDVSSPFPRVLAGDMNSGGGGDPGGGTETEVAYKPYS